MGLFWAMKIFRACSGQQIYWESEKGRKYWFYLYDVAIINIIIALHNKKYSNTWSIYVAKNLINSSSWWNFIVSVSRQFVELEKKKKMERFQR